MPPSKIQTHKRGGFYSIFLLEDGEEDENKNLVPLGKTPSQMHPLHIQTDLFPFCTSSGARPFHRNFLLYIFPTKVLKHKNLAFTLSSSHPSPDQSNPPALAPAAVPHTCP